MGSEEKHILHGWDDSFQIEVRHHAQGELWISWSKLRARDEDGGGLEILNDRGGHHPLQRGLPVRRGAKNVFRAAIVRIIGEAYAWERRSPLGYHLKSGQMRALYAFMTQAQNRFIDSLPPESVKVARRFPSSRWLIFSLLQRHPATRLRQLVDTCPGLLAGLAVARRGLLAPADVTKLVRLIIEGHPLDPVLDLFFERLIYSKPQDGWENPWPVMAARSPLAIERLHKNWKWLVRNATPACSPGYMVWPAPRFLPMSDAPKGNREYARWSARLQGCRPIWDPETYHLSDAQARLMSNLISKRADFPRHFRKLKSALAELVREGSQPSPKSNLALLARKARERRDLKKNGDLRALVLRQNIYGELPESTALSEVRWTFTEGEISARTLNSKWALKNEGALMDNCLAKLGFNVFEGKELYLSVTVGEDRFTAGLIRNSGGWSVGELKGVANADPPARVWQKVVWFLHDHFPNLDRSPLV